MRKCLNMESAKKITHAFISSRLDYNDSPLYGIPTSMIQRLQRIQNSAARIVILCSKSEHITPQLQDLHWLPVHQRIKFKIITLTYRCLHNLAQAYLSDLIHVLPPSIIILIFPDCAKNKTQRIWGPCFLESCTCVMECPTQKTKSPGIA